MRFKQLTDEQLREKTVEFRARIAKRLEGLKDADEIKAAEREALDEILPEAFAVVREAGWRAVKMRHFDVQLIGGMVLHQGKISEMRTGEGKTLVATLPCYLNALAGHGVHVVTVNDYLAKRDAEWMGKIYGFLGMTVGVIVHDLDDSQRREAYASDITYGTNNEFGFDYLRDNMKFEIKDWCREVITTRLWTKLTRSSLTRRERRLSSPARRIRRRTNMQKCARLFLSSNSAKRRSATRKKYFTGDYVVDEKHRTIGVTDEGWVRIEELLGIDNIADAENWDLKHYVETAIKAHALYKRDVDTW